jgi:uncharacterized membrane protein
VSDIGLFPPGAFAWFCALALLIVGGVALFLCLLIAWLRTRRRITPFKADRFFGYAIGAAATACGSGLLLWLINESGSLGAFSHWIDHAGATLGCILALIALWPAVAFTWNQRAFGLSSER